MQASSAATASREGGWLPRTTLALARGFVARVFPSVPQLSTDALAAWLADETREKPVLLDVRRADEYAVSQLPGARWADPSTSPEKLVADLRKDQLIVTYCAAGYRSSALAKRLQHVGYRAVQNLAGSIFQWANEDRPLEHDGKPATQVHPSSPAWSWMVKKERRAEILQG
jgi:rhodanese-related sulfurtransferase